MSNSLQPLYSPWNSPSRKTRVGSLSLLQEMFPTQGSNPGIPYCRQIHYQLSHKGSQRILEWVAYPFSSRSSWPRKATGVSCAAGGFFTNWAIREAGSILESTELTKPHFKKKKKTHSKEMYISQFSKIINIHRILSLFYYLTQNEINKNTWFIYFTALFHICS